MKQVAWLLLGFLTAIAAQAASFDCSKAQTKVEHIICDDKEASKLDDEMAVSYQAALHSGVPIESVKRNQTEWLRKRNACQDVACIKQSYEERLLALRSNISNASTTPNQILIDAIQQGDVSAISAAIRGGANVNNDGTGVNPGLPPLIVAILSNKPEVVDVLLKSGADPNLIQHDHYPIYDAVNADTKILRLLLDARANPNVTTRLGNYDTPLHRAATCHRQTYIDLAKSGGYKGNFPDCEMDIRLLLDAGAAIEAPGFHRNTPLIEAVYWNNFGSAKLLLAAGANVETRNAVNETPLMTALHNYAEEDYSRRNKRTYIRGDVLPMIGLLLEHGANPDVSYEGRYDDFDDARRSFGYVTGNTPLTLAARYGWTPVARLLLDHKADPQRPRSDGITPLAIAEKQGHKSIVELLGNATNPTHGVP